MKVVFSVTSKSDKNTHSSNIIVLSMKHVFASWVTKKINKNVLVDPILCLLHHPPPQFLLQGM